MANTNEKIERSNPNMNLDLTRSLSSLAKDANSPVNSYTVEGKDKDGKDTKSTRYYLELPVDSVPGVPDGLIPRLAITQGRTVANNTTKRPTHVDPSITPTSRAYDEASGSYKNLETPEYHVYYGDISKKNFVKVPATEENIKDLKGLVADSLGADLKTPNFDNPVKGVYLNADTKANYIHATEDSKTGKYYPMAMTTTVQTVMATGEKTEGKNQKDIYAPVPDGTPGSTTVRIPLKTGEKSLDPRTEYTAYTAEGNQNVTFMYTTAEQAATLKANCDNAKQKSIDALEKNGVDAKSLDGGKLVVLTSDPNSTRPTRDRVQMDIKGDRAFVPQATGKDENGYDTINVIHNGEVTPVNRHTMMSKIAGQQGLNAEAQAKAFNAVVTEGRKTDPNLYTSELKSEINGIAADIQKANGIVLKQDRAMEAPKGDSVEAQIAAAAGKKTRGKPAKDKEAAVEQPTNETQFEG